MFWIHIINNSFENIGLVHYQSPFHFPIKCPVAGLHPALSKRRSQIPRGRILTECLFYYRKRKVFYNRIKAACENGAPAYHNSSVDQTLFPFPHAIFGFLYDYLVLLKRSYLSGEISTTVFSPSTICASISPTLGAVPKPCPVKAQARIRPGTSSTGLITGTPS